MQLVYAQEPFPTVVTSSIFLAGPTPRAAQTRSWRPEALEHLKRLGFEGTVFIPEPREGPWKTHYEEQIEWEEEGLNRADCILFWLPRDMKDMPSLTTNDEWGYWKMSRKVVLGAPSSAVAVAYQKYYAGKYKAPVFNNLADTIAGAVAKVSPGAQRSGGETEVPLHIWNLPSFQSWYRAQVKAGNTLNHARLLYTFFPGKNVFLWILHVNVHIAAEGRDKVNEIVLSRPDTSTVVLYHRREPLMDSDVVLVREFRSPVCNDKGFVYEAPGGSSFKEGEDPLVVAAHEVEEETGLKLNPSRLRAHGPRQILSTLSAHRVWLFSAEITKGELVALRADAGNVHGVVEDSERTYVEVYNLKDLYHTSMVDWGMLGMIQYVLFSA